MTVIHHRHFSCLKISIFPLPLGNHGGKNFYFPPIHAMMDINTHKGARHDRRSEL